MFPLFQLPPELVSNILSACKSSDLPALARTDKKIHDLTSWNRAIAVLNMFNVENPFTCKYLDLTRKCIGVPRITVALASLEVLKLSRNKVFSTAVASGALASLEALGPPPDASMVMLYRHGYAVTLPRVIQRPRPPFQV